MRRSSIKRGVQVLPRWEWTMVGRCMTPAWVPGLRQVARPRTQPQRVLSAGDVAANVVAVGMTTTT